MGIKSWEDKLLARVMGEMIALVLEYRTTFGFEHSLGCGMHDAALKR
jgi:hypothetical protein